MWEHHGGLTAEVIDFSGDLPQTGIFFNTPTEVRSLPTSRNTLKMQEPASQIVHYESDVLSLLRGLSIIFVISYACQ